MRQSFVTNEPVAAHLFLTTEEGDGPEGVLLRPGEFIRRCRGHVIDMWKHQNPFTQSW
jgi:hypothetical protein